MSDTSSSGHRRDCPCKRVPLYLSSFTAAEHGDVHALQRRFDAAANTNHSAAGHLRGASRNNRPEDSSAALAGNYTTPLHLAAQHGHTAVTALLLRRNSAAASLAAGGATPLHRASFSGAVATMQLLLEAMPCDDDLLAPDTSFGDRQTPLHKAAAGGRYLALQLLLEALAERSLTAQAVHQTDAAGLTPLQVARQKQQRADEEGRRVVRWDSVAGGAADWEKCIRLLEPYYDDHPLLQQQKEENGTLGPTSSSNTTQRALPSHLQPSGSSSQRQQQLCGCEDNGDGQCLTASWERAFQAALQTTVDENVRRRRPNSSDLSETRPPLFAQASSSVEGSPGPPTHSADPTSSSSSSPTTNALAPSQGRQCSDCGKPSIVLYPSGNDDDDMEGTLVCKQCRRHRRRRHPNNNNSSSRRTSAPFLQKY